MLAHFAMKLPFPRIIMSDNFEIDFDYESNNAWRAGHFCAVCGALAVGFLAIAVMEVSGSSKSVNDVWFAALLASLMFGLSPLIWEYSITAEVFALNNMLCSLLLWLAVKIFGLLLSHVDVIASHQHQIQRLVMLGGFVSGLALSNQHTSLLLISYLVIVIFSLMIYTRYPKIWSTLGWTVVTGLCGLSPYAYLYFAGQYHPPGSWGDTSNIFGLLKHMLRAEYGTFQLGIIQGSENWWERIVHYLHFTSEQSYAHLIFPIVILGSICIVYRYISMKRSLRKVEHKGLGNKNEIKTSVHIIGAVKSNVQKTKKGNKPANEAIPPKVINEMSVDEDKQKSGREIADEKQEYEKMFCVQVLIWGSWFYYTILWHTVFSNLPLSSPMPYEVHARFWMQPSIPLYVLFGLNLHNLMTYFCSYLPTSLSSSSKKLNWIGYLCLLLALGIAVIGGILTERWDVLNHNHWEDRHDPAKSYDYFIHQYANLTWQTIPNHSLLLAHTDLDWNPIRYLRTCSSKDSEFVMKNVTHMSFQLIAFPWFEHYKFHYPFVRFPNLKFPGISTDRRSTGNRELVMRMLTANGINAHTKVNILPTNNSIDWSIPFPGGVYIDMQSVNDIEIQDVGRWYEYYLIPWGTQYRVFHRQQIPTKHELEQLQALAWQKHSYLRDNFQPLDARWSRLHRAGSWERAVANVITDSYYQLGLFYLTYAMEEQTLLYSLLKEQTQRSNPTPSTASQKMIAVLMKLFDRLLASLQVLSLAKYHVTHYQTISSSIADVDKNTALAYLRCASILMIVKQFRDSLQSLLPQLRHILLVPEQIQESLSTSGWQGLLKKCEQVLIDFVQHYPLDPDHQVFLSALQKVQSTLNTLKP